MSEKTRKGLVFGSLVLSLIWAYFNFSGPGESKKGRSSKRVVQTEAVPMPEPTSPLTGAISDSIYRAYESMPWGKNPFYYWYKPVAETRPNHPDQVQLHLLGVLFREYRAQALINDRIVSVGDEIEGYHVADIGRDSVVLKNEKSTITLWVAKESS